MLGDAPTTSTKTTTTSTPTTTRTARKTIYYRCKSVGGLVLCAPATKCGSIVAKEKRLTRGLASLQRRHTRNARRVSVVALHNRHRRTTIKSSTSVPTLPIRPLRCCALRTIVLHTNEVSVRTRTKDNMLGAANIILSRYTLLYIIFG